MKDVLSATRRAASILRTVTGSARGVSGGREEEMDSEPQRGVLRRRRHRRHLLVEEWMEFCRLEEVRI